MIVWYNESHPQVLHLVVGDVVVVVVACYGSRGCHSSNKMLSYRRETALQGTLVLAESGRLELGDNILLIL